MTLDANETDGGEGGHARGSADAPTDTTTTLGPIDRTRKRWITSRPWWLWVLAVAAMLGGSALIGWGIVESGPGRGVLGVGLVTAGLKGFNWLVRSKLDSGWVSDLFVREADARAHGKTTLVGADPAKAPKGEKQGQAWIIAGIAAGIGLVLVVVGNAIRNWPTAFVGVAFLALSTGPISLLLLYARERVQPRPPEEDAEENTDETTAGPTMPARRWVVAGLLTMLIGWLLVIPGWNLAFVVVVLAGFVPYYIGVAAVCEENTIVDDVGAHRPGGAIDRLVLSITVWFPGRGLRSPGLAFGLGVVTTGIAWWQGWPVVVALGVVIAVLGMTTLGVGFRQHADYRADEGLQSYAPWWLAVGLAGVAMIVLGVYEVTTTDLLTASIPAALAVAAVLVSVGAFLVWKGEGLLLGVLLGTVLVFNVPDSTSADAQGVSGLTEDEIDGTPREHADLVAFGDSWISGEGVESFFAGTDDPKNNCHRATTAYPVLLADKRFGGDLDFYACSGADIVDLIDLGRIDDNECRNDDNEPKGQKPCSDPDVWGRDLQIDALPPSDENAEQPDLVLVSVGGNDAGFGEIVQGCLMPGTCTERREVWLDNVATIGPNLEDAYRQIRQAFHGKSPVVVMPYPLVMLESSCDGSPLRDDEHEFVVEFTTVLNEQLKLSAARAGVHFFEPGMFSFVGHRVCETDGAADRAINLIELQASGGNFFDRVNPKGWTNNSMHPNALGHRLITENLDGWLDEEKILDRGPGDPINPEPVSGTRLEVQGIRPVRPFPVDTDMVPQECVAADGTATPVNVDGFATQVAVFDDPDKALDASDTTPTEDGEDSDGWWPVPITGGNPTGYVCYTDHTGEWTSVEIQVVVKPSDDTPEEADAEPSDTVDNIGAAREAYSVDGELFMKGRLPDGDGDVQWVMFQEASPDGDGDWELRAIRFCSRGDLCEASFDDWRGARIDDALSSAASTLLLLVVGGWLAAIGVLLGGLPMWREWRARRAQAGGAA